MKNEMTLTFSAVSDNEAFARNAVAAFCVGLDPTIDQLNDIKTAVSEAVTNSIVHAYPNGAGDKFVTVRTTIEDNTVHIVVSDEGVGIDDVDKAMQPFYTTKPEQERSGMGFTVMESFMDELSVERNTPTGTVIKMSKSLRGADWKEKKSSN
ncbi:MAG: anti-sigma F factor [Clostridia bacterium]|jgi:stage II sporulation protein AB (anti-sigma F factor)|nr:anti-sigma F factor [Clostridia bacterium]MCI9459420.1 anti-sigma F factor [Clostridia bacterium]